MYDDNSEDNLSHDSEEDSDKGLDEDVGEDEDSDDNSDEDGDVDFDDFSELEPVDYMPILSSAIRTMSHLTRFRVLGHNECTNDIFIALYETCKDLVDVEIEHHSLYSDGPPFGTIDLGNCPVRPLVLLFSIFQSSIHIALESGQPNTVFFYNGPP